MIDVSGLKLSLDTGLPGGHDRAVREIARQLRVKRDDIEEAQLVRRSVDARKKTKIHFTATYRLRLKQAVETALLEDAARGNANFKGLQVGPAHLYEPIDLPRLSRPTHPPLVVGAGPAGLFAAWYLAKCGLCPILVEQGAPVEERMRDVERFFQTGELDPWSNIQFGEGGAGTFSDGKLTTNTKNPYIAHVLQWLVEAGAPEDILWQAHPHIGSDHLAHTVATIRKEIVRLGGEARFHTQLDGMAFEEGRLNSVILRDVPTDRVTTVSCDTLILACGHSARLTFELMRDQGFVMEQKPFSMGVRIEHPQSFIDEAQWGAAKSHPALGAAEYKLAIHLPSGRSVYSFCMCPGGEVVAAASEEGGIVTNGMSDHARAGKNANAALLVNVDPADLPSDDVLAGVELQREVERRAYRVAQQAGGAPFQAPAQTLGSFLEGKTAKQPEGLPGDASAERVQSDLAFQGEPFCEPTYARGVIAASLDDVLPPFITTSLREALPLMGRKIRGFDDPRAILTAPETRSSSPVRICRDESLQAFFQEGAGDAGCSGEDTRAAKRAVPSGVYPCGEGPGFAGGIMSAAVDGLKVARKVAKRYREREEQAGARDVARRSDGSAANTERNLASFAEVVATLKTGAPALFPTDTVHGLGVAVRFADSPEALYQIKGRHADKPIAWLVGSVSDLEVYGKEVSPWAKRLAQAFWPGALTIVVAASDEVPAAYRSATGTIALRMPDQAAALDLIEAVGPLATTSANLSGEAAATCLEEIASPLRERVVALGGRSRGGHASCVVDATGERARILREGSTEVERFLSELDKTSDRADEQTI